MFCNNLFVEPHVDFYKFFEKSEDSVFHYNQALTFDLDEAQKNIINLKKPKE